VPTSSLTFRRAARGDVPQVVALVERAYRGEASRAGWTTEADLLAGQRTDEVEVAALLAASDTRFVLASRSAELVGSMMLARHDGSLAANGTVYVGMLAVLPTLQASGIGRALLGEAERLTRDERLGDTLRMTVIGQRSELIAWYERRGYRRTGEREPFPYGKPRFGLPRREDLYFEVLEKAVDQRER